MVGPAPQTGGRQNLINLDPDEDTGQGGRQPRKPKELKPIYMSLNNANVMYSI